MSEVFGQDYAESYDALYADKDYEGECDLIERLFKTYGAANGGRPIHTILDLGCGTGGHAIRLAERGYHVVGADRSPSMLDQARHKASTRLLTVDFRSGDISDLDLHCTFDAALMMFAVLGYQLTEYHALDALRTARRHLRTGGILLFDFWYGPAVVHERPAPRTKEMPTASGKIVRSAEAELDESRQLCTVRYQVQRQEDESPSSLIKETHTMRYFFPGDLRVNLHFADFALVRMRSFPDFDREPDVNSWNVLCVAQAI
ncbi:MAG: hypothetical protein QOE77_677 [Blastocatellia bacterium]|jgi:SAM-dependent methyltransferase|nr:hypothetical protein [Blastocatellia bacterium]